MAPLKPVTSLESLCVSQIRQSIIDTLKRIKAMLWESTYEYRLELRRKFKSYIDEYLTTAHSQLLFNSLLCDGNVLDIRTELIELLLGNRHFQKVHIVGSGKFSSNKSWRIFSMDDEMRTLLDQSVSLASADEFSLRYHGQAGCNSDSNLVIGVLAKLTNLKSLSVPEIATDALLAAVGRRCHCLKFLDVRNSYNISNEGYHSLIWKSENQKNELTEKLETIVVPPSCAVTCVTELLLSLPNLKSLGSVANVGQALERACQLNPDLNVRLVKLAQYETNVTTLDCIRKHAPDVERVFFGRPDDTVLQKMFDYVPKLVSLTLVRFRYSHLYDTLRNENVGCQLLHLDLRHDNAGTIDLRLMARLCPNLRELHFADFDIDIQTDGVELVPDVEPFPNLVKLCVKLYRRQNIIAPLALRLAAACQKLEELDIRTAYEYSGSCFEYHHCRGINDRELEYILNSTDCFQNLKSFKVGSDELTKRAVLLVADKCPMIKKIGWIDRWQASSVDWVGLKNHIHRFNLDIELLNYYDSKSSESADGW